MKLTYLNYYSQNANKEYMSYSQFKDFLKCPACAMAKIKGEWEDEYTDSLNEILPNTKIDWIIMNPPYSIIEPFVIRALEIA